MFRNLAIGLALAASGISYAADQTNATGYPSVTMAYSWLLDNTVAEKTNFIVKPEWVDELEKRTPEFQQSWNDQAGILLGKTIELTGGRTFKETEMHAAFVLCNMASLSFPLVLNVRRYLTVVLGPRVEPMYLFNAQVFHELLHTFVVENLPDTTPLQEKYKNEDQVTKNHLHLMAIQKAVYTSLGRLDELKALIDSDSQIGGSYKRSWDIVNSEDYQAFVDEFKK